MIGDLYFLYFPGAGEVPKCRVQTVMVCQIFETEGDTNRHCVGMSIAVLGANEQRITDAKRSTRVISVANVVYSNFKKFSRLKGVQRSSTFLSPRRRKAYVMRQTSCDIGCSLI